MLRNEDYELGTKIYNFMAAGLPILNTLRNGNNAQTFLKDYLLSTLKYNKVVDFKRHHILESAKFEVFFLSPKEQQ